MLLYENLQTVCLRRINPLSPPNITPNSGFRDLPAKSKFLAVKHFSFRLNASSEGHHHRFFESFLNEGTSPRYLIAIQATTHATSHPKNYATTF